MTDLNALRIFAQVVEAQSISAAARQLRMPVSTVSRRIADLEEQLGVRLLERSTRQLRLTAVGSAVFDQARQSAELGTAVESIVSNHRAEVTGVLRLSAPPSLSDTLLVPLISAFQVKYPHVRVQVFITERFVDVIAEGVDLVFRVGPLKDKSLVAHRLLTYRHQLVASPAYLARVEPPQTPADLLRHRLLAFARWTAESRWTFQPTSGPGKETLLFQPVLAMNDYAGLAAALVEGAGIGDLPPLVEPEFVRAGRLVEVMPEWRFRAVPLSVVHLSNRHIPRVVSVFQAFASAYAPTLFPSLPT